MQQRYSLNFSITVKKSTVLRNILIGLISNNLTNLKTESHTHTCTISIASNSQISLPLSKSSITSLTIIFFFYLKQKRNYFLSHDRF